MNSRNTETSAQCTCGYSSCRALRFTTIPSLRMPRLEQRDPQPARADNGVDQARQRCAPRLGQERLQRALDRVAVAREYGTDRNDEHVVDRVAIARIATRDQDCGADAADDAERDPPPGVDRPRQETDYADDENERARQADQH